MIIDSLTHITSDGRWFDTALNATTEALLDMLTQANVDRAIVAGRPGFNDNDAITELAIQHPNKVIPFAGFDFTKPHSGTTLGVIKNQGFTGVKIHPRLSLFSFDHPQFEDFLEQCAEQRLVVMICTIMKPPAPYSEKPWESLLAHTLKNHPATKVILAHGGYDRLLTLSECVRGLENVFLELSCTLTRFYDASIGQDIRFLMRTLDQRICFGSDFPEAKYSDVLKIFNLWGYNETDLEKRGVLGSSLDRFLNEGIV